MLAAERMAKILEILNDKGSVRVEYLAKELDVSEMTIRRDLEKCQKLGTVQRCYGGAVLKTDIGHEVDYQDKRELHQDKKLLIAQYCAGLVTPGTTVYLDAGTTTFEIAQKIKNIENITVVTNDLEIVALLVKSDVNIFLLGGFVQKSTGSMIGNFAEQMMNDLRVDISFMGAMCIDSDFDILTPTLEKAFLKRLITKNSNKSYLVVDSSKFYKQSFIKQNNLHDYTGVITDREFTVSEQKILTEKNINIINV